MTKRIISLATALAEQSPSRFRVGAVLYRGNCVYGYGFNDMGKTHPKSPHPFKSIHAEFDAVIDCLNEGFSRSQIHKLRIYIHRLKKDGTPGLAKPCKHCESMLRYLGIRKIEYSKGD